MPEPTDTPLVFTYEFRFPDGSVSVFEARLDPKTLSVLPESRNAMPAWARLEYEQCPNCPLRKETHPLCPAAASLHGVVERFKDVVSFDRIDVLVTAGQRQVRKTASAADAVTSLMGIYMAASGCPILDRLRPMLLTHIPFASGQETVYRSLATYLLAQYFIAEKGGKADWKLAGLAKASEELQTVNRAFVRRLYKLGIADAILNAVAHLDCFANLIGEPLREQSLARIRRLFGAYLGGPSSG